LNAPNPELEIAFNSVIGTLESAIPSAGRMVAFDNPQGPDGLAVGGTALVNLNAPQASVLESAPHELKHVIERIAFAEERNGLTNTPAQKFSARINGLFDDMTDEGKRNYVENYLYREELSELEGDAREARVQELLRGNELREEMTADFFGKRFSDKAWLSDLAKADPKGFESFVQKWLDLIDNLVAALRGKKVTGRESDKIDTYVKDLNKAKMVAREALIQYRREMTGDGQQSVETDVDGDVAQSRRAKLKDRKVPESLINVDVRQSRRVPDFTIDRKDFERRLKEDGGVTYNADGSVFSPDEGYVATLRSKYNTPPAITYYEFKQFANAHRRLLRQYPSAKVGAFVMDDGTNRISMDLNIYLTDRAEAERIGRENNQKFVWGYQDGEILTGGEGGEGMSMQQAEAVLREHDGEMTRELSDAQRQRFEAARRAGTTGLEGAIDEDGQVFLTHYSHQPITRTDPTRFGQGLSRTTKGDRDRLKTAPPRTYFGLERVNHNPYKGESGLGSFSNEYKIDGAKLYNLKQDPENLYDPDPWKADENEWAIYDAGYDGYFVDSADLGKVAAVFVPLDAVEDVRQSRRVRKDLDGRAFTGFFSNITLGFKGAPSGKPFEPVLRSEEHT